MRLHFLGATTTVTGSQFLLETDHARVLVDCGMFQGSPHETEHNRLPFAFDPGALDALLLTHAHLDHSGMIPVLARDGFRGPIFTTRATVELTRLVLLDSGKLQEEQVENRRERAERLARREAAGRPQERSAGAQAAHDDVDPAGRGQGPPDVEATVRSQPPNVETAPLEPLYTVADAERSLALFRGLEYEEPVDVAPGVRAVFRDAGHILGSAIIVVDVSGGGGETRRIVFSGDLGRPNAPIIRDPTVIEDGADYLLCESTYGGRRHDPAEESTRQLAEAVRHVATEHGVLLIPAFAIGRTQEIVWSLDRLLAAGEIPHVPLYLDSPMASHASDIYRAFPGYYDDETHRLLEEGGTPLDYPDQIVTRTADQSKAIARAPRPMIIVSSNGMLTGGRVVFHLRDLVDDPRAAILFVGYQGEGTPGAHLQAGVKEIRIDGVWRPVRCEIRSIGGFSAHADEGELVDWLRPFATAARRPKSVFVVHGDPDEATAMEARIRELGLQPYRPAWREAVDLD